MKKSIAPLLLFMHFLMAPIAYGDKTTKILFLGDSLTAGYGLPQGAGFPEQLAEKMGSITPINAGVSGDTTTGLLDRLDWATGGLDYDVAVVAIGANDALMGIVPHKTRANMQAILTKLQALKKPVLILGMIAPPNLGDDYAKQFNSIYSDMAKQFSYPLFPFLLQDVATVSELNQPDTIHPNQKGVAVMVKNLYPFFKTHLKK